MLADPSFREATRLLNVTLQIVEKSVVTGGVSELQDPPNPLNSLRPPLYFKGSSKESEGIIESTIKGCVYEEEDGSIRWRFVRVSLSIPDRRAVTHHTHRSPSTTTHRNGGKPHRNEIEILTETRPLSISSCGVQVGSVGSAIGVIGVWTTVSHSEDDPVGERRRRHSCLRTPTDSKSLTLQVHSGCSRQAANRATLSTILCSLETQTFSTPCYFDTC